MKSYKEMSRSELEVLHKELEQAYEDAKGKGLKLDMSRGKPAASQLDMTMPILDVLNAESSLKRRAVQTAVITVFWTESRRQRL